MEMDRKTPASFPLASSETDVNGEVECCIEKAVMDLLSQCVFSGIMITYDVPGFPLYYIDERMLSAVELFKPGGSHCRNWSGHDQLYSVRGPGGPAGRDCTGPSQWDQLYNDL